MHRMGDFIIGKFSPQLLFHLLNHLVTLLRAFGKTIQYLIADALDFKSMLGRLNPVADLLHPFRQFIPINRRAVTDGVIHSARLQGFPAPFAFIKRGVEHREMRVQLRVQFTRAVMHEGCGHEIAGRAVTLIALLAHSRGGEGFEFAERNARGFLMGFNQSLVVQRHRQHRYGFGRCAGEIEKHPALVFLLLPLRQAFASIRISIFTQRMKLFAGDGIV